MAFPTTGVLDTFNRANETPLSLAGMWSSPIDTSSTPNLSSNQIAGAAGGFFSAYTDTSYAADQEAFLTSATLPVAGRLVSLFLRIQDTNIGTANFTGYQFQCVEDGTGKFTFKIFYQSGGSATQLVSQTAVVLSAGDKIGAQASGSTLTFYKFHTGAWSSVTSATDTHIAGGGHIGFELQDSSQRIDDFGGGVALVVTPDTINATAAVSIGAIAVGAGSDQGNPHGYLYY